MAIVLVVAIVAVWLVWKLTSAPTLPTPNAAPAPEPPHQGSARAHHRTAPPALRVHLCIRCLAAPVARSGDQCYPYCESVVHDAERILRETAGGVA